MKSWKEWYSWSDQNFVDEFIKDLIQSDLSKIKWRFDKRANFADMDWLKTKVANALKGNKNKFESFRLNNTVTFQGVFRTNNPLTDQDIEDFLSRNFASIFNY